MSRRSRGVQQLAGLDSLLSRKPSSARARLGAGDTSLLSLDVDRRGAVAVEVDPSGEVSSASTQAPPDLAASVQSILQSEKLLQELLEKQGDALDHVEHRMSSLHERLQAVEEGDGPSSRDGVLVSADEAHNVLAWAMADGLAPEMAVAAAVNASVSDVTAQAASAAATAALRNGEIPLVALDLGLHAAREAAATAPTTTKKTTPMPAVTTTGEAAVEATTEAVATTREAATEAPPLEDEGPVTPLAVAESAATEALSTGASLHDAVTAALEAAATAGPPSGPAARLAAAQAAADAAVSEGGSFELAVDAAINAATAFTGSATPAATQLALLGGASDAQTPGLTRSAPQTENIIVVIPGARASREAPDPAASTLQLQAAAVPAGRHTPTAAEGAPTAVVILTAPAAHFAD